MSPAADTTRLQLVRVRWRQGGHDIEDWLREEQELVCHTAKHRPIYPMH